ncbi:MAG: aldehyde dehydrogenase family protein, partial [Reichenbachiella sp.]|uniref:aldehyde dehydrogenase family protein n=1 Tax=Reichenbachiella sp. TaxID=2184521 RepID=UPI003296AF1E
MSKLSVYAPFDQSLIKEIPLAKSKEMSEAIDRAHALFSDQTQWIPKHQRVEILENIAFLMEERSEEIIQVSAMEGGKRWMDSEVEMKRAINGVKL